MLNVYVTSLKNLIWWWHSLERNTRNRSGCGGNSDDLENLFQSWQAAAHLEGHLVCVVLSRDGQTGNRELNKCSTMGGDTDLTGITWFLLQQNSPKGAPDWKLQHVTPEVFLSNVKSAQPGSEQHECSKSTFNGRQMLCMLQFEWVDSMDDHKQQHELMWK